MARIASRLLILSLILSIGAASASAQMRGFGFGGPMAMAFIPDMTGINTFLSENGLPSMGEYLLGVGGSGRGGIIGGPTFGGVGWGIVGFSEAEGRSAEFAFGGGGFDMGRAIGGDDSSVLTVGAVLGGGANVMTVTVPEADPASIGPNGLVIEPESREFGFAMAFVQPYLSMAAQILPWMGFEFRLGYILPLFGMEFGDTLGIPAPSLELSGITVSFGLTFGGIASSERISRIERLEEQREPAQPEEVTFTRAGSFELADAEELVIENAVGRIEIESYRAEVEATTAPPLVSWEAEVTANPEDVPGFDTQTNVSGLGATVSTFGDGEVDYYFRIPAGIDLRVKNGIGEIHVTGHEAQTIILDNGAGEVHVDGVRAEALFVTTGLGSIRMEHVDAEKLIADVFIGEIDLGLASDASAELLAKARLGEVSIDRFPGMVGGVRGLLGETGDVVLGEGEQTIELKVGIGSIKVWSQEP